jgi:hypothetical protein
LDTNVFRARFGKWITDREKRSTAMPSVFGTTKRHGDLQQRGAHGHGNGPASALQ